jgi:hypothetical protein
MEDTSNGCDVKTPFLNGIIEEEVCVEQPWGFEVKGKASMFVGLIKPCMDSSRH